MFFSTALAPVKFEEIFLRRTKLMNMYKMYKNRLIVDLSVSVSLSARLCLSSATDPHFYQEFHHNYETDTTCGWSLHIQGISLHINPFPLSTLDRRDGPYGKESVLYRTWCILYGSKCLVGFIASSANATTYMPYPIKYAHDFLYLELSWIFSMNPYDSFHLYVAPKHITTTSTHNKWKKWPGVIISLSWYRSPKNWIAIVSQILVGQENV